jgi:hypothetical protein
MEMRGGTVRDIEEEFQQHVKNSCLQKFSPLYFTGKNIV